MSIHDLRFTAVTVDVTRTLARYLVNARYEDLPAPVRHEAARALLNFLACTIGSARHETIERALAAVRPFSGPPQATVLGRSDRLDILHAALLNGISAHVLDFDDTHARAIHPSAPVLPALLAYRITSYNVCYTKLLRCTIQNYVENGHCRKPYSTRWQN